MEVDTLRPSRGFDSGEVVEILLTVPRSDVETDSDPDSDFVHCKDTWAKLEAKFMLQTSIIAQLVVLTCFTFSFGGVLQVLHGPHTSQTNSLIKL